MEGAMFLRRSSSVGIVVLALTCVSSAPGSAHPIYVEAPRHHSLEAVVDNVLVNLFGWMQPASPEGYRYARPYAYARYYVSSCVPTAIVNQDSGLGAIYNKPHPYRECWAGQ
jgi:hypothetical protein